MPRSCAAATCGGVVRRRWDDAPRRYRDQRRNRVEDVLLPPLLGQGGGDGLLRRRPASCRFATLRQTVSLDEAARLPDSVTGGGQYGTETGAQLLQVRIYAPYGGELGTLKLDGETPPTDATTTIDGRPVATVTVLLSTRDDLFLTWSATSGAGQTGHVALGMSPGVVPGNKDATFRSAC